MNLLLLWFKELKFLLFPNSRGIGPLISLKDKSKLERLVKKARAKRRHVLNEAIGPGLGLLLKSVAID